GIGQMPAGSDAGGAAADDRDFGLVLHATAICKSTPWAVNTWRGSVVEQHFEAAVDHPLHVERRILVVYQRRESLVGHDRLVDAVTVGTRLEDDPRQHHGLAPPELDA